MNTKEIFNLATKMGIKADLRGEKRVLQLQKKKKEQYEKLPKDKRKDFDKESLDNPFMDSGIHFDSKKEVKKVLCGIDIDTSEMLLAKELGDIDLVIGHHPVGKALARLHDVMEMQVEVLSGYGIPINIAQGCLRMRIAEVGRGVSPINHYKAVDSARLLKTSLMNIHTPCDNLVANFLKKKMSRKKFEYVSDVIEFFEEIPEYAEAKKRGAGPKLFAGSPENFCGKIALTEITGGTSGAKTIFEKLQHS